MQKIKSLENVPRKWATPVIQMSGDVRLNLQECVCAGGGGRGREGGGGGEEGGTTLPSPVGSFDVSLEMKSASSLAVNI
jgi:hypothetical protein